MSNEDALARAIAELLDEAGVRAQRKLIERLVETSIGLGRDGTSRANLKLSSAALSEMRRAFRIFAGHDGTPKVTIFGSARTLLDDPLWVQAEATARRLAEQGWMVVTGAGPGIMEAAARGAGPQQSLGVSIRLPFEEKPNDMINQDGNHVAMRYFFTRKLMLVKESSGFVCLPGGFGTLDETFELLTLQQTGKMLPAPIVLLDRPGGGFWRGFERFVREELTDYGMISPGDLDRVLITDSVEAAVEEIEGFWRNFDSLRWTPDRSATGPRPGASAPRGGDAGEGSAAREGSSHAHLAPSPANEAQYDRLVLRLRNAPSEEEIAELNERFADMLAEGRIEATEPLQPEVADRDRLDLPRLTLVPTPRAIGRLHVLIRAINELGSAPSR
ncbi:TIGR00730 family Rossman fold protein [Leucobacter ruminantium]|uniref:TIGR00730 family Rossman fold protein n=2 Tax=Leucobacter ruminantium TaxID=1289170 RepID=A0A939LSX7_9MICO|nr:TIGR00730 family Rossman fold protein [Leucobacter ruminantium]